MLQHLNVFDEGDIDAAAEALDDVKSSPDYSPEETKLLGQNSYIFSDTADAT